MYGQEPLPSNRYWSFPNNFCIATVCEGLVKESREQIHIYPATTATPASCLYYNNSFPVEIVYDRPVNEVTTYFKPLGIHHFTEHIKFDPQKNTYTEFNPYEDYMPVMSAIMQMPQAIQQLDAIEAYWLNKLSVKDLGHVAAIVTALEQHTRISDIALQAGVSRQYLHRIFCQYIGKSPAEFRKTHRFRSIIDSYKKDSRLTRLTYDHIFFDQAHFNKEFKELTGLHPKAFFRNVDISESNFWLFL